MRGVSRRPRKRRGDHRRRRRLDRSHRRGVRGRGRGDCRRPGSRTATCRCRTAARAGRSAPACCSATGDPIVFLDADLTIPVEIIDKFVRAIDEGADIAIASRYVAGSVVRRPWWRRLMGSSFRACVRALVPTGVQDTQCGGKAYTAEAAKDLFLRQRLHGFAFDAEVLFLARRARYRVTRDPVRARAGPRDEHQLRGAGAAHDARPHPHPASTTCSADTVERRS